MESNRSSLDTAKAAVEQLLISEGNLLFYYIIILFSYFYKS